MRLLISTVLFIIDPFSAGNKERKWDRVLPFNSEFPESKDEQAQPSFCPTSSSVVS